LDEHINGEEGEVDAEEEEEAEHEQAEEDIERTLTKN
jgi:hypothetical protein